MYNSQPQHLCDSSVPLGLNDLPRLSSLSFWIAPKGKSQKL